MRPCQHFGTVRRVWLASLEQTGIVARGALDWIESKGVAT